MFAPVATRFRSYSVALPPTSQAYVDTVCALAPMREWIAAGAAEPSAFPRWRRSSHRRLEVALRAVMRTSRASAVRWAARVGRTGLTAGKLPTILPACTNCSSRSFSPSRSCSPDRLRHRACGTTDPPRGSNIAVCSASTSSTRSKIWRGRGSASSGCRSRTGLLRAHLARGLAAAERGPFRGELPRGTSFAITPSNPVRCYLKGANASSPSQLTDGSCPSAPFIGLYPYSNSSFPNPGGAPTPISSSRFRRPRSPTGRCRRARS